MGRKVFIDGQEGTTGLQIRERLLSRADIELLEIEPDRRKDPAARRELLRAAELAILCLPDAASREAVALAEGSKVKIIDASTAFRTDPAWAYGIPELTKSRRAEIRASSRVSNPGCYATGFAVAVHPLVAAGIVDPAMPVSCTGISGCSGGGKKLIEAYAQARGAGKPFEAPRHYALALAHKHVPEMQKHASLAMPPLFSPAVCEYYKGMTVSVPLHRSMLRGKLGAEAVRDALAAHYDGERFVKVMPFDAAASYLEGGFLDPRACNDTNRLELHVFGHDEQILVVAVLDNLGKGASGAAVQNLNLMLGAPEDAGLTG